MARFFVAASAIQGDHGTITGQELQHLRRVLRLRPGDRVTVFDESGREHDAIIRSVDADKAALEITRSYEPQRESSLNLTLALGLTKGEKMDLVVEKATELGVQAIVPFVSRYAVPKLDERKVHARAQRWHKIAVSAAKQCGRTQIPALLQMCSFTDLVSAPWPGTLKVLLWEKETVGSLHSLEEQRGAAAVLLAVGPEGGFSAEEAAQAEEHGFFLAGLGRRTLRAETAAITAVAVAQFVWGDLR
jgi:16S rRNA (uracil1498-N3)-methyltransferase